MESSGSVTRLVEQLRSDNAAVRNEAARQIWQRYFSALLDLACRHLDPRVRQREDEEDVVQSVYKSLCLRLGRGEYTLGSRDDLWRLLVTMIKYKARHAATRQRRQRRDYRREQPVAAREDDSLSPEWVYAQMEQEEPTPADGAALAEELRRRLDSLEPELRQVALWRLEGYINTEIAEKLGCVERTVERKLVLIRKAWEPAH